MQLNEPEARVIGCLVEKEATTPDNYPLTVNALISACNQKSNRNPVMDLDEETVTNALDSLRDKNLVYLFHGGSSRVPKYKHLVPKILDLSYPEVAVICVLLLRGPQTPGEIKSRSARLYNFADIGQVEETLRALNDRETPLVKDLGRQPGQKGSRFAHLLSGEVELSEGSAVRPATEPDAGRFSELKGEVDQLRDEMEALKESFEEFRSRFE